MGRRRRDEGDVLYLSPLEEDLLTLLVGRELYGLVIMEAVRETGGRSVGFGSLYPTLHKLEKKGFAISRWGEDIPEERRNARRRYYRATGLGERALRATQRRRQRLIEWQPA